ncbi:MAG: metal-dependent transcriptional regulator [bacterium]|nr:metal-dependent transcriptional regulator [bacterium]
MALRPERSNALKLTQSNEDYLEAIVMLAGDGSQPVRSVDLANQMGVSKPSVNKAIAVLKKSGLIEQEPYGDIFLTKRGVEYGKSVLKRHHTLTRFLVEILGVDPDLADDEACEIEHTISDDTFAKWESFVERSLGQNEA